MNTTSPPDLRTPTPIHRRTYAALLAEPDRPWTVADMAGLLLDVPVNRLRTTLLLLLGDQVMDIEPCAGRPALTLRLTSDGQRVLAGIVRGWATNGTRKAASAAQGGRNVR